MDTIAEKIPLFKDTLLQLQSGSNILNGLTTSRVLLASLAVFATSRILSFFRGLKVSRSRPVNDVLRSLSAFLQTVSYLPGFRPLFHPLWLPGALIPTTWWNMGIRYNWIYRATCVLSNL